jgi:hypothetical protein
MVRCVQAHGSDREAASALNSENLDDSEMVMATLDDADHLDLAARARELSEEAEALRNSPLEPLVEQDSRREANEDLDKRLAEPLNKLRRLAK